jgi:LacI family transcriptional regulator
MSVRRIAKLAGLSPAAVSMALHDHPKISSATRRRVRAIARRLSYKPNVKVAELMGQIRSGSAAKITACLGVISFYESERPWAKSLHLGRMYEGMRKRANALGYRLEPFWLRAPGTTPRRLRAILDARAIEGLLCLGSPNIDEDFPPEFDHFAIVTQGLSIRTHLHRVINHAYNETWHALEKVYQAGYRRPGLILGQYEDVRGAHCNLSAYFGWCEKMFGNPAPIPVLRLSRLEEKPLLTWLKLQRPDVVVFVHVYDILEEFSAFLHKHRIQVPQDLGVVVLSQLLKGTNFSGFEENQQLMGEWAVELLMARIMNRDFGIPNSPRIEMVESRWIEGRSLRPQSR